jgi:adenosine deaminase
MGTVSEFIAALPKAELHMHLEGSLEPEMLFDLGSRNGVQLPYQSADTLRAAYRFDNLQGFLDLYYLGVTVLQSERDFYEMTDAYLARAATQNVRHAEVFIGPQGHTRRGVPLETVMEGILAATESSLERHGLTCGVIVGLQRQWSEDDALKLLGDLTPWRDRVIGLGLGGPEIGNPPRKFTRAFEVARCDCGWHTVAHAGEEGGPDYVRDALHSLKVDRVDHGIRCEEPDLMAELKDRGTPLTVCPHSNCATKVFPSMAAHNIRRLHEAGLCVTVNSDDPAYFGGYINENYAAIQGALGLSDLDLWEMARNGFTSSFADDSRKARWLRELEAVRPAPGTSAG